MLPRGTCEIDADNSVTWAFFFERFVVLCRCLHGQLEGVGISIIVMFFPSRTFETNRSPAR